MGISEATRKETEGDGIMKRFDPQERCGYCGGPHNEKICPKTWSGSINSRDLRCSYCGARDHDYDSCPKHA